ncbi:MAG: HU family DNA-binding protein [Bacteroidaceae bacterium]|uniref:HU family DNA-binding protein n=1 Tax=unclassified Bacteroides TaxID=2646097 RepID=UPI0004E2348A|nr:MULTISPECIES: HU family DNA-binding protein [unclassified Bacteroides]MBO4596684.1 HU family DNA-binding protein [Bacteroidaceae bacterium]MBQ1606135.1 HU family DNA-binding protein [Bacteroidales bacterium]MBP3243898.1 HU family DNA-binding protein [Bacteroidaceae bacterium]MBP5221392.1 HU family DNA-binding protein [Bacteroidaceae bacterium]MBQ1677636.1 HU family DNA-binding protein [Bacteroidaceae bacterium]
MNNKEFITEMANRLGYSAKDAAELQKSFTEEFAEKLISESSITVPNFGTFEVKKKKERIIVNPTSKERMLVPPKLVVGFKPYPSVKIKFKK